METYLKRTVLLFTLAGVVACAVLAGAQVTTTLVDTESPTGDIFNSYLTTWPPEAMDANDDGVADIDSYRSRDVADNAYKQVVKYPYYTAGLDGTPGADDPFVTATYWVDAGVFYVQLSGGNLKPNFAYQVKLIGKPEMKWEANGSDWANEQIGAGRWWCTKINNATLEIVDAWNSTDSEYQYWKSRGFTDGTYTYLFEGYLLFDFVLTNESGSFGPLTLAADSSYHVLWQCNNRGTTWNRWGYRPHGSVDKSNIKSVAINPANAPNWYSGGTAGRYYVVPEIEDSSIALAQGTYPAILLLMEESFHANLPPQYGPAYHDKIYGGCWMSAMCAHIWFSTAANSAPTVTITSPADGATFESGATIPFAGTASDAEDGDLTANLTWTSSIDGPIGTGGTFSNVLSNGTHTITASATDSGGKIGSASITITVGAPAALSVVVGTDKGTYVNGETVWITVAVADGIGPVGGASVHVDIRTPKGQTVAKDGTTNTDGVAIFQHKVNSRAQGVGTYRVDATASKAGYSSGSGWTIFLVN